jgi:cytochrome c-type biogenesis protein CcmF
VGAAFAIFWGTIFPLVSQAVRGTKITVGPPFYNQIMIPIGLALLLLTAICPLISWRKASGKNLRKNFLYPLIISVIGGVVILRWTIQHPYALISFTLAIFVTATIIIEFAKGTKARKEMTKEGYLKSLFSLIIRNKRRYGGYIIHIGMVCLFVGITGSSAFKVEKVQTLKKGESFTVKDYRLELVSVDSYPTQNKYITSATLAVYRGGKKIGSLRPEKNFYTNQEQTLTEVALRSTLKEDLYVILTQYSEDGSATFKVVISPLIMWMWLGGVILVAGTILAMWPGKREKLQLAMHYIREMKKGEV